MQPSDKPTALLLKLWPWIEANKTRLIVGGAIVVIVVFLISFFTWQRGQTEIAAGKAYTELAFSVPDTASPAEWAGAYQNIEDEYPGTLAAQRAELQSAGALFVAGKYADAQARFQQYLDTYPDGKSSGAAALGVAASLEAQGKLEQAIGTYQRVIDGFSDVVAANTAKIALARIAEAQGRFNDALNFYESIGRFNPGTPVASEASMLALELRTKMAVAVTRPAAAKP